MWFCPIDGTLLLVRFPHLLYVRACGVVCACVSPTLLDTTTTSNKRIECRIESITHETISPRTDPLACIYLLYICVCLCVQ